MKNQRKFLRKREPTICPKRFRELVSVHGGIGSVRELVNAGHATITKVLHGEHVSEAVTDSWWGKLGTTKEEMLLSHSEPNNFRVLQSLQAPRRWKILEIYGGWITAPNGVQFRRVRLQHEVQPTHTAVGKFYDLLGMHIGDREERINLMARHSEVMARCKDIRIATLLDVYPFMDDAAWWVVEEELDGVRLDVQLKRATSDFSMARVVWLGTEILLGLRALHAQQVVARELSPSKIHVLEDRLVLTDFEMAKIFSGASSVSGDWEDTSDYRAPEVSYASDKLRANCDLFSWAKIVVVLLTDNPRSPLDKVEDLPENTKNLLEQCISALPRNRPSTVEEVLERWTSSWGNLSQDTGSACT